jgi:cell division protein ZapA
MQELASELGQVGEARLLLLAALMVTDDLAASRDEITRLKSELTQASESLRRSEGGHGLDRLALRLESIAAKLENA